MPANKTAVSTKTRRSNFTRGMSKLYKAELVERAQEAGIDTEGLTKPELIDALEASEGQES